MMQAFALGMVPAVIGTVGVTVDNTWAEAKVEVTREESKPKTVEVKAGAEVPFVDNRAGNAHEGSPR